MRELSPQWLWLQSDSENVILKNEKENNLRYALKENLLEVSSYFPHPSHCVHFQSILLV